ncbi:MAG: DeoR/GlpR family DNA-binding transcription regulator [Oscillospiraceae bacterium]|jgi:DeoR family myo-inositol catabolism operon transcriptional repressor|nr:DeoR/GlpR family DNA-binding transcription regulator [Oscillospiraceae bacterium]
MIHTERLLKIEEYIMEHNVASMNELCDEFAISMNTLRIDIAKLAARGSVEKVYGGVKYVEPGEIPLFEEREGKNIHVKRELCKKAVEFIKKDDVIYIDAGSTVLYLTDYLDPAVPFTVLTSSLPLMQRMAKHTQISLISISGKYQWETGSFVSLESTEALKKFNIKTAIMVPSSVSNEGDFTISNYFEYEIKKEVIQRSYQTIMISDSGKIGVPRLRTFAKLSQIDYFITDSGISQQFVALCGRENVSVLIADAK